ncbi:MAG: hypothetical protein M3498_15160 [Deinococcota bacterium]|jgi:hypothetical protein|nr:hypothetical protein [Deinococcota bacterium]
MVSDVVLRFKVLMLLVAAALLMLTVGAGCMRSERICIGQWGNPVPCPDPPNLPHVSIAAPLADSIVTGETITVWGSVSSNRISKAPIVELVYQLDGGSEVAVSPQGNGFSFTLSGLPEGVHDISVSAKDSAGQSASSFISINYAPGRSGRFFLLSFKDMTGGTRPPCMDPNVITTAFVHVYFWRAGGFSAPIALVVEGLPPGVSGVFPADLLQRSHELRWLYLTLEIADPSEVSPGTGSFRIRGVSGDLEETITVPLIIEESC